MHTEEEAKKLWCPFSRVTNKFGDGGGNRWDHTIPDADCPNGSTCVAVACMAWRWANDENGEPAYQTRQVHDYATDNIPLGYCGLAGKPE